jgi:hypothetical protein
MAMLLGNDHTEAVLRSVILGILGVCVLAACGHHNSPKADRPPSSRASVTDDGTGAKAEHQLDCAAHILAHGPSPSYRVVLGAVALQVWPETGVLQTSSDHTGGVPRLFAKTGLLVRPGVSSTITVKAPSHRVARIGWRNGYITPTRRLQIPACPADGTSRWLAFPGGYWVDRPTCVEVTVHTRGDTEPEHVAVGARCS